MSEKRKIGFGKVYWPSLLASLTILIILFLIVFWLIGSLTAKKPFTVESDTVLHMTLNAPIAEEGSSKFNPSALGFEQKIGLADIQFALDYAKKDQRIKGIFLEIDNLACGYATATEVRNALKDFQSSGKFIVAYHSGEAVTLKEYYLASVANENYGFSTSMMEFNGLGVELMYFKKLFDDLDIEMQIIRGKNNDFKSAVEPFFKEEMSDSSRVQLEKYINSIWYDLKSTISTERNVSMEDLEMIADSTLIRRCSDAVDYKLLDAVKYRDEVISEIAKKVGADSFEDINFMAFEKYADKKFFNNQEITDGKNNANVAVIIAQGSITKNGEELASDKITNYIREARMDENIKTIVLRVNSPGGSALASDEIWREVKLAKETKKVVVSMGDVAASGGYYISAPADYIFAENTTITGSIGVFGAFPYFGDMLENKLGITIDRVSTNPHAVLSLTKRFTEEEIEVIQEEVDEIYSQFLSVVAEGRDMTVEEVNKVARGRVWTGRDAVEIGLVDTIGGVTDAINYAANLAGIDKPVVQYWPKKKKNPLAELLENLEQEEEGDETVNSQTEISDEMMKYYYQVRDLDKMSGIQARMPYFIDVR